MKVKHILIVLIVLFLVFIGIWIISPKVGEKINIDEGIDVEYQDTEYDLPTKVPDGMVRDKNVADAIVYRASNSDGSFTYYEYVGNDEFVFFDLNRPSFLVRSSFNKKIYQIQNESGTLREEYRAFDGEKWQVVTKNYDVAIEIPSNYTMLLTAINVYLVDNGGNYSYKLLTKVGETYAWLSPNNTDEWIDTVIPPVFAKTEIPNIYKATIDGEEVYKKVLIFNDAYKTIAVVSCDKQGKFI